jgi:hypothetical protein
MRDEARRIAANVAKLTDPLGKRVKIWCRSASSTF